MTAIVCVDKNWAIGRDNALLFHISAAAQNLYISQSAVCLLYTSQSGAASRFGKKASAPSAAASTCVTSTRSQRGSSAR